MGKTITVQSSGEARNWALCLRNIPQISGVQGSSYTGSEQGVVVTPEGDTLTITL